jgi:hypothetical protein
MGSESNALEAAVVIGLLPSEQFDDRHSGAR